MWVVSTQLENISLHNIENVINLLAVADSYIDVWGNNTPDMSSLVDYASDVVETSGNIQRATGLQHDSDNMERVINKASNVTDLEMRVNVSGNKDANVGASENIVPDVVIQNIDRLVQLRDIQNDIIGNNYKVQSYGADGLGVVYNKLDLSAYNEVKAQNVKDNISLGVDVGYEMTVGNLIREVESVKDNVNSVVGTGIENKLYSIFGEFGQVVSNCMVSPIETIRGKFSEKDSVVENIINKIPIVKLNADVSTGVNNIYSNVIDNKNNNVTDTVNNEGMLEAGVYRNDIVTARDSIEIGKSVAINEVDKRYMLDSVSSVNNSKVGVSDVNVTINNNNNISTDVDADAIIAKLSDGVRQAMNVAVSGVYA